MSCLTVACQTIALLCAYSVLTAKILLAPGIVMFWLLGLVLQIPVAYCLGVWRVDRGWRRSLRARLVAEKRHRRKARREMRRRMRRVRRLLQQFKLDKSFANNPRSRTTFWNSACQWCAKAWSFVCNAPKTLSSRWQSGSLWSWARAVPMLSATLVGSLMFAGPMLVVTLFGGIVVLLMETVAALWLWHQRIICSCIVTDDESNPRPKDPRRGFECFRGELKNFLRGSAETNCSESPSGPVCSEEHSKVQLVVNVFGKRFTLHAPLHATVGHVKKAIEAAAGV
eukprot:CAMPEP_0113727146 /NCGR_PEP_ID=MMETSP0038_2-20120614/40895_1 /TAXON_ID=2898 /ORGANISM="Cryptomonas paramecium" /LENGTH=282 /DNA_ID=CAMNT_0000657971 /DNA_START=788 /DNA_END=1633 /DNA_ORIENTATION=+ /assembly_acc=CAM_ASM_000170